MQFFSFMHAVLYNYLIPIKYYRLIINDFLDICIKSLLIISLTLGFLGASLAINAFNNINFQQEIIIPKLLLFSMLKEAGPLLSCIILNARVGSGITAKIGIMKITDQINSMPFLGVNPIKYLILPKQYASILSAPIIFIVSNLMGLAGGGMVYKYILNYNLNSYIYYILESITLYHIYIGLCKTLFFCIIISFNSCYYGYTCDNNSKGLSTAIITNIVLNSILILVINYLITQVCS